MDEFKLYDEQLEKFQGILAENGLVGEILTQKYPIEVKVKRNPRDTMQLGLFKDAMEDTAHRETKLVLTFPIGETRIRFFGKLELKDKTLNKIKSNANKLRDLYLQGLFAILNTAGQEDEE
jgi:hypothetical protein